MTIPASGDAASSTVAAERAAAWGGAALFAASLAASAYAYLIRWAHPSPTVAWSAAAWDAGLIALFAAHHSGFARAGVKSWLARRLPERLVRVAYVWAASLLWIAVVAAWQPIGGVLFAHGGAAAVLHAAVQIAGLLLIAQSVRTIDPLELAGVRPAARSTLQVRGPYRLVRHPVYFGWVLVVCGAATMTGDRLAFAAATIAYIVVAIPWEERSLEAAFGAAYRRYQAEVRWRLLPYLY